MLWSAEEAQAATGGTGPGGWQVTGVSIDTRSLQPGDLFVALKDVRDGHDFVAQALEKGAGAALVTHLPEGVSDDAPLLVVPDVLKALEGLARAARSRTQAKVIGVTGSVGKTSTKEMLRAALSGQGVIHAAEKSFNNHWGVPLTLARMPRDTDFAVIEIGMNHPGEIAPLARLAGLDVAVVTIVAPAHLEAFESLEGIAREKASIFEGLGADGVAIFNGDQDHSPLMRDAAPGKVVSFGAQPGSDWQLQEANAYSDCTVCLVQPPTSDGIHFKLAAPGLHFAMNAVAALAAVDAAGADVGRAVVALGDWHPPQGRGQRHFVSLDLVEPSVGIDLFDDAYNANPASVGAALDVLSLATPPSKAGRRIAVLGDMRELGRTERALHAALARHPAMAQIDQVHCVGPLMEALHAALPEGKAGLLAHSSAELAAHPAKLVQAGDAVLVKGSLSMKMALIVDAIRDMGHSTADQDKETP